jgi:hypothetical protein
MMTFVRLGFVWCILCFIILYHCGDEL